jgi:hypothetical protein
MSEASKSDIAEQYKVYVGDLGNVGSRYATAQAFYLSVVSALLAILAIKENTFVTGDYLNWVTALICLFIAAVCWLWYRTLMFYGGLFKIKFDILRAMEAEAHLFDIYKQEDEAITKNPATKGGLVGRERVLPRVIGFAAALIALVSFVHPFLE